MLQSKLRSFFSFLNPSNVKDWFRVEYIFVNYFWFFSICALYTLIFHKYTLFNVGFPIILYLFFFKKIRIIPLNIIDCLWVVELFWIITTWLINDYPHQGILTVSAISREMAFMFAYWIVRCNKLNLLQEIIEKSTKPLVIGCVIGLYCFFFEPTWYKNAIELTISKYYTVDAIQASPILEQYRLRSFYQGTYVLAYFCAIVLIYEFYVMFIKKTATNRHIIYVSLLVITSLLCMMRAPIFCYLFVLLVCMVFVLFFSKDSRNKRIFFILILLAAVSIIILFANIGVETIDFLERKVNFFADERSGKSFILDRLFLQAQSFTICGDGYGKYSPYAYYNYGLPCVADGEYMKIISEQGFVGLSIMLLMFIVGFTKALFNFKQLFFEMCLIFMLLVCMVGADPLSIYDKHCFIFWMALGQISRYSNSKTIIKNE